MKYVFALLILSLSAPSAFAQVLDEEYMLVPAVAPETAAEVTEYSPAASEPMPSQAPRDTSLRSDRSANLRSDVTKPILAAATSASAQDFSTLAPAAGGRETEPVPTEIRMRSDINAGLRSDSTYSQPR
jgi:hypothetical protein